MEETREQVPQVVFVKEGGFGGWDVLTKSLPTSNMSSVIATFADLKRANRAGEKIADAFGAKFIACVNQEVRS